MKISWKADSKIPYLATAVGSRVVLFAHPATRGSKTGTRKPASYEPSYDRRKTWNRRVGAGVAFFLDAEPLRTYLHQRNGSVDQQMIYPVHALMNEISGSLFAARHILPILWRLRRFEKVIDVGCGAGAWLRVAQDLGATEICGIERQIVPDTALCVPPECVCIYDLEAPMQIDRTFDLCISVEVAEHLPKTRAASFVRELCSIANVVLFSAAVPFQGGHGHINEQWPVYWARHFSEHRFDAWDGIRQNIWAAQEVPWWYRQNALLFVSKSDWANIFPRESPTPINRLSLVHPECFLPHRGPMANREWGV
jgi:SAM-dependent methyltransferase